MKKAILATKIGMTQIFNEAGVLIPVTVLQAGPCVVTQVKTEENDGYNSVQVAYGKIRTKLVNKAKAGHLEKAGIEKKVIKVKNGESQREIYEAGRFIREFKFENAAEYAVKDEIKADIFAVGDMIDAGAISKGKGFQEIRKHKRTYVSRFKVPQTSRFKRFFIRSEPCIQGQEDAGTDGCEEGYYSKP